VAGRNGVIRVAVELGTSDLVTPPRADLGSGRDRDDSVVLVLLGIASHVGIVNVLDGVIVAWGADALQLALLNAINRDFLKDGVGAGGSRKRENLESLHLDQSVGLRCDREVRRNAGKLDAGRSSYTPSRRKYSKPKDRDIVVHGAVISFPAS